MQTIALQIPKPYRDPKHIEATAVSTHGEATVAKMGERSPEAELVIKWRYASSVDQLPPMSMTTPLTLNIHMAGQGGV
jgi:hypothetical protein